MKYWTVERDWSGATVAILGGGPSLSQKQIDNVRDARFDRSRELRVIAINCAYQAAPWADLLYFCDYNRFWLWHRDRAGFRAFAGTKVALEHKHGPAEQPAHDEFLRRDPGALILRHYGVGPGLCGLRDGVHTGRNSGYQAINLAFHLGAARIVLLGYDMRSVNGRTHWHSEYRHEDPPSAYANQMLPCFPALAGDLAKQGVEVLNATPASALTCFRVVDQGDIFAAAPRENA